MSPTETLEHTHDHNHAHDHTHATTGRVDRRRFLVCAAATGAALTAATPLPAAAHDRPRHGGRSRVVDLTHRLRKDFPTFSGDQPSDEIVAEIATDGFFSKRWTINEHTGTHVDTPGHFVEGMRLVDQLEADSLLAPIVVVDIRRKARDDPNAMVEPDDLMRFERRHGRIPDGALVAMNSGWAAKAVDPLQYLGGAAFPDFNFPGFSVDAADWLAARRDPVAVGVDTASLDPGNSTTFDVHVEFLGSDHYGVENLTGLDRIPPRGARAFVGPIPWQDGSGSPCRVLASW